MMIIIIILLGPCDSSVWAIDERLVKLIAALDGLPYTHANWRFCINHKLCIASDWDVIKSNINAPNYAQIEQKKINSTVKANRISKGRAVSLAPSWFAFS